MYYYGQGVQKSFPLAFQWFHKSAEQGNVDAQYGLGSMYESGQGVKQNDILAYVWTKIARDNGYDVSNTRLAKLSNKIRADVKLADQIVQRCLESNYQDCEQ